MQSLLPGGVVRESCGGMPMQSLGSPSMSITGPNRQNVGMHNLSVTKDAQIFTCSCWQNNSIVVHQCNASQDPLSRGGRAGGYIQTRHDGAGMLEMTTINAIGRLLYSRASSCCCGTRHERARKCKMKHVLSCLVPQQQHAGCGADDTGPLPI